MTSFATRSKRALVHEIELLLGRIARKPERDHGRPLQIMEVCGGHTHSIFRYRIAQLLPDSVKFVHGPGCPVCVLPMGRVDDCVALAEHLMPARRGAKGRHQASAMQGVRHRLHARDAAGLFDGL
ncbi:hypothetical protein [Polaromonas sp.]|uniref:hypothetical protein n=1 Tax=Polaromonas sp. TaxID=1869339 RepID=UPI00286C6E0C|nr:hypothetical protein [Polaromonas sp.]